MTCLPSSAAMLADVRAPSRRSSRSPRISSISGMTGTGLKKCMPTKPRAAARGSDRSARRGDGDRDWCCWRGSRTAGAAGRARRTASRLTASSSKTASTTRSAPAAAVGQSVGDGRCAPSCRARSSCVDLALRDGALEVRADARRPGFGAGPLRLVQRDVVAGRGHHLGDAVAHQAGAAHEHLSFSHRPKPSPGRCALARNGSPAAGPRR